MLKVVVKVKWRSGYLSSFV